MFSESAKYISGETVSTLPVRLMLVASSLACGLVACLVRSYASFCRVSSGANG